MIRVVRNADELVPIEALDGMGIPGTGWWRRHREAECMRIAGSVRVMVRVMRDEGSGTYWFGLFTLDGETGEVLSLSVAHQAGTCGPFDPEVLSGMMADLTGMTGDDGVEFYA